MRWSEPITIYLAAGAPFGVSRYLCVEKRQGRLRAVLEGAGIAFFWPLMGAAILFKRLRHLESEKASGRAVEARGSSRVEEAVHAFMVSVNEMLEVIRLARCWERDGTERALYALREGAEQYAGLARVEAETQSDAQPAAHEMELARISGRLGDDLLVAGRCAHRRNVSRIKSRYERERARLLRKLRELRQEEESLPPIYREEAVAAERRKLSEARLEIYLRATDLFSLLEDAGAARSAAVLLYEERSCLQRLLSESGEDARVSVFQGEERCTEQSPQLMYKDRLKETTFTQG